MTPSETLHVTRTRLIVAFAAVYLIWGSTYLGIRFAIETIPPFIMCGFRFLIGGALMYAWARMRGMPLPSRAQVKNAILVGVLMMVGGTGSVTWAEQTVPSGLTALVVGTVPLWIVFFDWLSPHGRRPTWLMTLGLAIGTIGIGVLVAPGHFAGADQIDPLGALVLVLACASWAWGSIFSRHAELPANQPMSIAIQLFAAGLALVIMSPFFGEWGRFDPAAVSGKSVIALLYLAIIGLFAFAAYLWLIKAAGPARAATYAYVNPIVAVLLGTTLGNEPFALRTILSALIIVVAVVLIITAKSRPTTPRADTASNLSAPRIIGRVEIAGPAAEKP